MFPHQNSHGRSCTRKRLGTAGRRLALRSTRSGAAGFSLLEMMASIAVLLVVAGGVFAAVSYSQKTYVRTEEASDMYENVRAVAELIAQEVGQSGLVDLPPGTVTLSANVTGSGTAQTVAVSSTTSMFANEYLLVDTATNEEPVFLTAVTSTSITGIFARTHSNGAVIRVLGVAPDGVVAPGMTDGSTSVNEPSVSVLNLWGDLNGDGTLVYVRYTCDTTTTPGNLTRSETAIVPGGTTLNSAQTLLSTLIPNPNPDGSKNTSTTSSPTGVPCFQFTNKFTQSVTNPTSVAYSMVTNVGLTLSVQSLRPDPVTGTYLQMTKSFLDISPRNILAAYEQAYWNDGNRLQQDPTNLASY
jgi:prepilin-type N-terminal cleavage/methylation domain-containing protein